MIGATTIVTGAPVSFTGTGTVSANATATCAVGQKLLGGGAQITQGSNQERGAVAASYPSGGLVWTARGIGTATGTGSDATVTAYVICGSVPKTQHDDAGPPDPWRARITFVHLSPPFDRLQRHMGVLWQSVESGPRGACAASDFIV